MNERMQEMLKASTTIEYGVDNGFDRTTVDQEKFADLVCAGFAKLRDELVKQAFDMRGQVQDPKLAEIVYKLNSCLKQKY